MTLVPATPQPNLQIENRKLLTQLSAVKSRLSIPDTDPQYDALLTTAVEALPAAANLDPTYENTYN